MAAPDSSTTIEGALGGLPLVKQAGLNTNQAVNFSGWTVTTGGVGSGNASGPTGSFNIVNITAAAVTGPTGATATIGVVGALDGGPTTAAQNGWATIYVGGVKCWVPIWV